MNPIAFHIGTPSLASRHTRVPRCSGSQPVCRFSPNGELETRLWTVDLMHGPRSRWGRVPSNFWKTWSCTPQYKLYTHTICLLYLYVYFLSRMVLYLWICFSVKNTWYYIYIINMDRDVLKLIHSYLSWASFNGCVSVTADHDTSLRYYWCPLQKTLLKKLHVCSLPPRV